MRSRSLSCGKGSSAAAISELEEHAKNLIEGELGSVRDGILSILSNKKDAENEALNW